MSFLSYIFWPNPPLTSYSNPKVLAVMLLCLALVVGAYAVKKWRAKQQPVTKKLSRNWASAAFGFGLAGLFLVVCRVEGIQFFSMRFFWVLWAASIAFYLWLQMRLFRARHYEVMPAERVVDPMEKYLPGRKKR